MDRTGLRLICTAVGTSMLLFGASQTARPQRWHDYIPDWLDKLLPLQRTDAMRVHGCGNLALGTLLVSGRYPKATVPLAAAWWAFVLPFCTRKEGWRTGARDIAIVGSLLAAMTLMPKKGRNERV